MSRELTVTHVARHHTPSVVVNRHKKRWICRFGPDYAQRQRLPAVHLGAGRRLTGRLGSSCLARHRVRPPGRASREGVRIGNEQTEWGPRWRPCPCNRRLRQRRRHHHTSPAERYHDHGRDRNRRRGNHDRGRARQKASSGRSTGSDRRHCDRRQFHRVPVVRGRRCPIRRRRLRRPDHDRFRWHRGRFERFCEAGETDISNASRPIDEEEIALCQAIGRNPIEFRVGTDALAIVVSPEQLFCRKPDARAARHGVLDRSDLGRR